MGQYYKIVNLDKRQYLHPHRFGDGLKLMEFAASGDGVMCGLAVLLADGNGRGGGDLDSSDPLVGSWAGDRVVIAGDYGDPGRFLEEYPDRNIYDVASEEFEDISDRVIRIVADAEGEGSALSRIDPTAEGWRDK